MDGDAYRDLSHCEIQQILWRMVAKFADYANIEQRLNNGKRADVFYQCGRTTVIIEVKMLLRDSLIESAWNKYNRHCDYLIMACPPQHSHNDALTPVSGWHAQQLDRVGIWWVSWDHISERRPACRLDVKTPGHVIHMDPASSPFAVIGSAACTARTP